MKRAPASAKGQRPALNMDLPSAVALAARNGDIDAVREWLAAGGAPNAIRRNGTITLLGHACISSRPSSADVAEILCAAGARDEGGHGDGMCLAYAALYGAVDTVRVLLRYGASANATFSNATTALHQAVCANEWNLYKNPWTIDKAKAATSLGHQGIVRLLLKHGAAVHAVTATERSTPLMIAADRSGFVSLGVVKELLRGGADLDLVDANGNNAEAIARSRLSFDVYTGEGITKHPSCCRRPGGVEAFLALLADVRAAGSWKRYANEPRVQLVVLRKLAETGRARVPRYHCLHTRLFARRTLPDVLFWKILEFWRTDRDP